MPALKKCFQNRLSSLAGSFRNLGRELTNNSNWSHSLSKCGHRQPEIWFGRKEYSHSGKANGFLNSTTNTINSVSSKLKIFLNNITDYSSVEALADAVTAKDLVLQKADAESRALRESYDNIIEKRRNIQREMNRLIQRKETWTPDDIQRFTEIYRIELDMEKEELNLKNKCKKSFDELDNCYRSYLNMVRERYVREQLYSDKSRRLTTYWTCGLIVIQIILFVMVNLVSEPRKRKLISTDIENNISSLKVYLDKKFISDVDRNSRDYNTSHAEILDKVPERKLTWESISQYFWNLFSKEEQIMSFIAFLVIHSFYRLCYKIIFGSS